MTGALVRSLMGALTRFSREERGASAMVVAIALPGLIGFGALGAETGLWYTIKLRNQSAADAAAISAAYEVIAGKTNITSDLMPAASEAAAQNAYMGTIPAVAQPYSDGIVSNGVAVTLQQTQGALLASPFLPGVTITSKAVAVIKVLDNPCILARATNGTGVEVAGASNLTVAHCSVAANSTSKSAIDIHDNTSSITAATLVTPGEISFQGNPINPAAPPSEFTLTSRPLIGAPSITDPYAGMLTHAFLASNISTTRVNRSRWNETASIKPALYTSGMWFGSKAVIDLTYGTYWLTGQLTVQSGAVLKCSTCVNGAGVTMILTATTGSTVGNVQILSGATIILQAPNSGKFSGFLFVQDPLAISSGAPTPDNAILGGPAMSLTGLLYFPNTTVAFAGNSSTGCAVLISYQAVIQGNSNFTTAGCSTAGLTTLPTVNTVVLAE